MTEVASPLVAAGVPAIPTGLPGPVGNTGLSGANWADNSPSDGQTYGRQPGSWVPVVPLIGATVSSGINFGTVVVASATDLTKHISFQTNCGFSITNSTLNYVGPNSVYFNLTGAPRTFAISGISFNWSNASYGFAMTNSTTMQIQHPTGVCIYDTSISNCTLYGQSGIYCTGELTCNGVGVQPYLTTYTNGFSQRWDGTWIYARVDQAVEYAIAQACDERMKQDIVPSEFDALAALRNVRLYQYRWKDRFSSSWLKGRHIPIGFVAQRLAEDYPHGAHAPGGKARGATRLGTANRNVMLATLCRAVQQLDDRMQALR
jgi:hypothetical protein